MTFAAAFLVALAVLQPAAGPVPLALAGDVRLNELLAGPARDWNGDGTVSSRDDEWVEVLNTGTETVDLSVFLLTDGDRIPRYAFTGSLAGGARRVVYGKDSYDWEKSTGHPAYGLSLSNSGDAVLLWQVSGPDTLLVDSYAYLAHEAAADRAVGRAPDPPPAGAPGAWALFDGLNPYSGTTPPAGTGCSPSPGGVNACTNTPVRPETWGKLKAIYK